MGLAERCVPLEDGLGELDGEADESAASRSNLERRLLTAGDAVVSMLSEDCPEAMAGGGWVVAYDLDQGD